MRRKTRVILQPIRFRKRDHVAILCQNNPEVDSAIREMEGAEWSTGYRFWHMPIKEDTIESIVASLKSIAMIDTYAFHNYVFTKREDKKPKRKRVKTGTPTEIQKVRIEEFKNYALKNGYSEGTVKIYICLLNVFFGWLNPKNEDQLTVNDVQEFIKSYIETNNFTLNYKRLMVNALRRYFSYIEKPELAKF
jgi:hypothetical protein